MPFLAERNQYANQKTVSLALVVVMLFALAMSTFADSRAINGGSYSAGTVRHKFTTSASATKQTHECWSTVVDSSFSSYFYTEGNEDDAIEGYHDTYVVDESGTKLTGSKRVGFNKSETFYVREMAVGPSTNTVKLQIYNPMYNSGSTTLILKTTGALSATKN